MEIKTSEYWVWVEGATVFFEGTMRLSNDDAYAPIQEIMSKVLASAPPAVTLDLTGLEFLNSSGINLFAKFTIEVRKLAHTGLAVRGSGRIPWQSKSLPNLKNFIQHWIWQFLSQICPSGTVRRGCAWQIPLCTFYLGTMR